MAPNQKTTQQKKPKANCFLNCFGISSKPTSSKKKKPKKIDARKKFFKFKLLRWPKLKVITIEKRRFSFDDAKAATLKTSHDIILEATKAHQQRKRIDHHVSNLVQEPKVPSKGIIIPKDIQNHPKIQSNCDTCHREDVADHKATSVVVRGSWSTNKVIKDSLLGMAIMIAMLVIMSIWGRFCAILCMSAWLYCIPLFRVTRDVAITQNNTNIKLDNTGKTTKNLNLELYKKKVVLQGLLQRDHKNAIGIS
ncbi:uncharacterized protein At5g23160-like [Chenopodium quinoa]|uniref:Uncharacterized protein n=1 Tax=Chenopodium quinoa TaxID=63459 RepID=A0A803LRX1_CHEQI|nr:uncharacterized protein At5g23160-like [Chenopodium quinoa]